MTRGEQNTEAEGARADYALARGINPIDTAEMSGAAAGADPGLTETYIGTWLASRKRRQDLVLASKVAGPVRDPKRPGHIRDGKTFLDRKNLTAALDASLKRLRTDYLDLYQLHWPDRTTATFGKLAYPWTEGEQTVAIEETLSVLQDFVREGKVRHVGVSNRNALGRGAVPQARREPGAAAHRVHPECLQPAQPRVRERPVGILAPRRRGPAGLFAAGHGHALWQVPGRRPGQRARA